MSATEFELSKRAQAKSVERYGEVPLGAVIRTDERYGHDGLLVGPRGWDYWNRLENPSVYQNPNLWPDKRPTYFIGEAELPAGASLTLHGRFPNARYFKFALLAFEHGTYVSIHDGSFVGAEIEPDPGSGNPYVVGADRTVEDRNFTIHIVAEDLPEDKADRPTNTLYVGAGEKPFVLVYRIYMSDEGYDGAGWGPGDSPSTEGPGYTFEGKLADGTVLSSSEVIERFARPLGDMNPQVPTEKWYELVNGKDNDPRLEPETAPARVDSQWEAFYGMQYTVIGAFKSPEVRAKMVLQTEMEGAGDPTTLYMVIFTNRKFGSVYVFRAKMPTFPDTYGGTKVMTDGQVQYWSVATVASGPSGDLWDGVSDLMVPLDDDGFYTIVVSRPEDRPTNATDKDGVAWIDWGPGEGLEGDPRNRTDFGMLLMRFMVCHKGWEQSPLKATEPGTEAEVMGPYYPRGYYTTKEAFEAQGPMKDKVTS